MIFKGYLATAAPFEFRRFVDWLLKIRRGHFIKVVAPEWAERLVQHARTVARQAGRAYLYCTGSFNKQH